MWTMMTGCSRVPPCRLRPLQGPFRSTEVWVRGPSGRLDWFCSGQAVYGWTLDSPGLH